MFFKANSPNRFQGLGSDNFQDKNVCSQLHSQPFAWLMDGVLKKSLPAWYSLFRAGEPVTANPGSESEGRSMAQLGSLDKNFPKKFPGQRLG